MTYRLSGLCGVASPIIVCLFLPGAGLAQDAAERGDVEHGGDPVTKAGMQDYYMTRTGPSDGQSDSRAGLPERTREAPRNDRDTWKAGQARPDR